MGRMLKRRSRKFGIVKMGPYTYTDKFKKQFQSSKLNGILFATPPTKLRSGDTFLPRPPPVCVTTHALLLSRNPELE